MSDFGIKVAKPGFDVGNADVKDQVFNSEHNSLKIWMTGSKNITIGAGISEYSAIVAHNLGYIPFFLVYFKLAHASKLWFQNSLDDSLLPSAFVFGRATADDTNLNLHVQNDTGFTSTTATAYYKILIDKAFEA